MPRLNRKGEIFSHITDIGVFRDTAGGGSSTITGTLPTIDTLGVQNAVSGTGFIANDFYRLRANDNKPEIGQVASIAVNAITPKYRLSRALAVGDPIVEVSQVSLGHIAVGTPRLTLSGQNTMVSSEILRRRFASLLGSMRWQLEFGIIGKNLENLMTALGQLDTAANILGAQTSADPLRTFINGEKIREQNDLSWYIQGQLKDGHTVLVFAQGCEVDYSAVKTALNRGTTAVIPVRLIPTSDVRIAQYL